MSKSKKDLKLDDKQVTLLGFNDAGWERCRLKFEKDNVLVHNTTTPKTLMSREDSEYWKKHSKEVLEFNGTTLSLSML